MFDNFRLSKNPLYFSKPADDHETPQPSTSETTAYGSFLSSVVSSSTSLLSSLASVANTIAPGVVATTIIRETILSYNKPNFKLALAAGYATYRVSQYITDRLNLDKSVGETEERRSFIANELAHMGYVIEGAAHMAAAITVPFFLGIKPSDFWPNADPLLFTGAVAYGLQKAHLASRLISGMGSLKSRWEELSPTTKKVIKGTALVAGTVLGGVMWHNYVTAPPYTRHYEQIYPERELTYTTTFAFRRNHISDRSDFSPTIASDAVKVLETKTDDLIHFTEEKARQGYDGGGTCSSMALDFAARFMNVCSEAKDAATRTLCVQGLAPFYTSSTGEFASRQAAYNSINVDKEAITAATDITAQKISALAHYHGMNLEPVMKLESTIESNSIMSVLKELEHGQYVVRMLDPATNEKLEHYGHTMAFFKDKDLSVYYDNSKGAALITGDVMQGIYDSIMQWSHIPKVRIYKAVCPNDGCINLSG